MLKIFYPECKARLVPFKEVTYQGFYKMLVELLQMLLPLVATQLLLITCKPLPYKQATL